MTILYIISTPLGHNHDITLEAINILKTLDVIAAENLLTNKKRMEKIIGPLKSQWIPYFDGNEITQSLKIIMMLKEGKSVGLISGAGTPIVCDPGYKLIQLAYKHNIQVVSIGGPCAVIGALSVSGAPPFPFTFWGFFPKKINEKLLNNITNGHTHIFFDSSHRIKNNIGNLWNLLPKTFKIVLIKDLGSAYFQRILLDENNYNTFNELGQWVIIIYEQ
jgi:16S rRNA (cytidine1402-2'-O)-methyltransferase